jgi:radical SAM-linked protein
MEIKKDGYMKYISHLDMIKLFRNAFKMSDIKLAYSQGFNPHPKMGFAQPLSLGYSSTCELLEFEVQESIEPAAIIKLLQSNLPKGIEVLNCKTFTHSKSFAARTFAATYEITIPIDLAKKPDDSILEAFLMQEKILALKKQKKTGNKVEIDIKNMIRTLTLDHMDFSQSSKPEIVLTATLDSGSNSNLSPELLLSAFTAFVGIETAREEVDIKRTELFFER